MSILEIVLGLAIFAIAMPAILQLFTNLNRTTYAADRLVDATIHGQMILEAVLELQQDELPTIPATGSVVLFQDGVGVLPGGTSRWDEVVAFLAQPVPVPGMIRTITAERFAADDRLLLVVSLEWRRVGHEAGNVQSIRLQGTSTSLGWS